MIRASLCILLVLVSTLVVPSPAARDNMYSLGVSTSRQAPVLHLLDPNGTRVAFNATNAQFDLYKNNTATVVSSSPGNLTWFSTLNDTQSGFGIPGTAFNYNISRLTNLNQSISWKLTVPRGISNTTFLRFSWNGTLGPRTIARYQLYNDTSPITEFGVTKTNSTGPLTFQGGPPKNSTGGIPIPLACGIHDECYDISRYVGFNLTLTFTFNSTSTGQGLKVRVEDVEVGSEGTTAVSATSHSMTLINPAEVLHTGKVIVTYSSNVTYPKPHNASQNIIHTWNNTILTLYLPASYRLENATLNATPILPAPRPFSTCFTQGISPCTNVVYYSLNMTSPNDRVVNATVLIYAKTDNAVTMVTPSLGGVDTNFWTSGENMTLKVTNRLAVASVTGRQDAWFTPPSGVGVVSNSTISTSARNGTNTYTVRLPTSPTGNWTITTRFLSGYDYGTLSHKFIINRIRLDSFGMTGGAGNNTPLNSHGGLVYDNLTVASNVNATVFAVDAGSLPGPVYTNGTALPAGLYVTTVTLVNGVFNASQPLTMLISIKNPTSQQFSANLTIEHEWCSGCTHGVNVTLPLDLGDQPFLFTPVIYRVLIHLTVSGIQIEVRSLQTNSKVTVNMGTGTTSPVPPTRSHFGLFNVTIVSKNLSNGNKFAQSVESPPYAFLVSSNLIPSRLLAYSGTVTTNGNGNFSATLTSDRILAAKRLVLVVLARDAFGIVLGPNLVGKTDNTIILPTADIPGEVTVNQSVEVSLHLKNNSTRLTMSISVSMDLTGPASIQTQTKPIVIAPGDTGTLTFTFAAPSTAGPYTVIFSSREYGAPLLTKDLRISLVPSSLQVLIPALVALIAALVIVAAYMVRRRPGPEEPEEKPKPSTGKPSKPQPGAQPRNP